MKFVNVDEAHRVALQKMDSATRSYYDSGAMDEITMKRNQTDFERICLRPRVLRNVKQVSLHTNILGNPVSSPIGFSPSAMHGLVHPDGECATAAAAASCGCVMTLSTYSNASLESVKKSTEGKCPLWLQLYVHEDRRISENLIRRAADAGFQAIVLTADAPVLGRRWSDLRQKFSMPDHLSLGNFTPEMGVVTQSQRVSNPSSVKGNSNSGAVADKSLTWKDLDWIRAASGRKLKLVIKGIMTAEDALLACEWGVDAIFVSNHGGRQLDTAQSSIAALAEVKAAVDAFQKRSKAPSVPEIYLDGGVRRGTDVVKALAIGARGVFIGRPVLWGLCAGGKEGVEGVMQVLEEEIRVAMALLGTTTVAEIHGDCISWKASL